MADKGGKKRQRDAPEASQAPASQRVRHKSTLSSHAQGEPDTEMTRKLRRDAREAHQHAKDLQANARTAGTNAVVEQLEQSNAILARIKRPAEGVTDARTVNTLGATLVEVSRGVNRGPQAFDTQEFLDKLNKILSPSLNAVVEDGEDGATQNGRRVRARMHDEDDRSAGWAEIGRIALKYTRRIPVADFMVGPLNIRPKPRKTRAQANGATETQKARSQRRKDAPQTQPKEFVPDEQEVENDTSERVKAIHDILMEVGGSEGVQFLEFICHPTSFGKTVENLFHLSFLFKEGTAALVTDDESDGPIVFATEKPTDESKAEAQAAGQPILMSQCMFELDMATWREIIQVYKITEPMIPDRD